MRVPISNDVASWGFYVLYNPTKRNEVEIAIKDEIGKALKDGLTETELVENKNTYATMLKTMLGLDNTLIKLENNKLQYGVSLDEYDVLNAKIAALKLDEVNSALRKYLSLDQLTSVYAGDFNKK